MLYKTCRLLKIFYHIVYFFLLVITIRAEQIPHINNSSPSVTIGGEKQLLLFEVADLSGRTRSAIASDINKIFDDLGSVEIHEYKDGERGFLMRKYNLSTYKLNLKHEKALIPEILRDYFGVGVKHGDIRYLIVHRKVIAQYRKALQLQQKHRNAFDQVDGFLSLFNDRERREQISKDIENAQRFFLFHNVEPWDKYETYAENLGLNPNGYIEIRAPSLLDFRTSKELGGLLTFSAIIRSKEESSEEHLMRWPFVRSEGKWRILIFPLP